MSSIAISIVFGYKSSSLHIKPYSRSSRSLAWNPISKLPISKSKDEISLWNNKRGMQCDNKAKRKSFVVHANSLPGAPLPSGSPPSKSMSWILGIVVSVILPFFTNKWGPLWVLKNRIENAVQTVENIVEAVEKVAEEVDKIAENIEDDLPEGKLKDLVGYVENMAEKTAKTADSLDNLIDKVQEADDQIENIVESIAREAKNSNKESKHP
ncbi:hypothetical protein BUALT_Bualt08G0122900 [Buddleja alternifolia]|uniref:Plastid-targeted protein 4 n=1 Tax=Buddleja alternifolia TaxID=168488 RepID=A0AAV6X7A3_9LAMI|nr:hypothetical protein BUALT_Bualt08G0122900 [Buddleja alternifolia]